MTDSKTYQKRKKLEEVFLSFFLNLSLIENLLRKLQKELPVKVYFSKATGKCSATLFNKKFESYQSSSTFKNIDSVNNNYSRKTEVFRAALWYSYSFPTRFCNGNISSYFAKILWSGQLKCLVLPVNFII